MPTKKVLKPKEVVIKFMDDWNAAMEGDLAKIDKFGETCDPKMIFHWGTSDMTTEEFKEFSKQFVIGFPGNKYVIEDIIEVGNKCAVRYKWTGTNTGEYMGSPPTNKTVTIIILEWDIIKNGKFIESWAREDTYNFLQQMGLA
jgi:predicted ester cyclase